MPIPNERPEKRGFIADEVVARLEAAIVDGTLQPGDPLENADIQAWLQVSRAPVTEALITLESAHMVETMYYRTPRVADVSAARAMQGLSFAADLLAHATRLVVPVLSQEERAELALAVHGFTDTRAAIAPGGAFDRIMTLLDAPRLLAVWRQLSAYARWAWARGVVPDPPLVDFDRERFEAAIWRNDATGAEEQIRAWTMRLDPIPQLVIPPHGRRGNADS